jgi:hypothetical protein
MIRSEITIAWLVLSVCVSSSALQAQSLQFAEETIEVRVCGQYCTLTGTYTFKNHSHSDTEWSIFYPLLNTTTLPFPDSLAVLDMEGMQAVPFASAENGLSFIINVPANSGKTYRVFYRQPTPARTMEYILVTTKQWGRPLERATFLIVIPDSLQLTKISLPYDSVEKTRNGHIYYVHKTDFLPEKNLIIKWREKKP